ncbi:MAG: helix-turn-helix transcriptional regulator [Flavobacteriaceae bacterium]
MIITKVFYLKNMLSNSCIKLIELFCNNKDGVKIDRVILGEVKMTFDETIMSVDKITSCFKEIGFDIIVDPNVEIVEKTKIAAIELIYMSYNANSLIRNSDYISDKLQLPYDKISRVFSQVTGVKLEKYIILLKLEKAKEMLCRNEYTVSEIAFLMDYSSVQYFSNQFKKNVGVTISKFKETPDKYRKSIEELI